MTVFQVVEPLLKRGLGHRIELVDTDDEVLWEYLCGGLHVDNILLLRVHLQLIMRMDTDETCLTMIEIVGTPAEVKIHDAHVIDLLHLVVQIAQLDVIRQGLGNPIEDAFEIVELTCELDFYKDNLSAGIDGFHIYTVVLVVFLFLIPFTLKNRRDGYLLAKQHGNQSFENVKISLVAKHTLHGPVKTNVFVFCYHNNAYE